MPAYVSRTIAMPPLWHVLIAAPPSTIYDMFAVDEGLRRFWAESAIEIAGMITFVFPNGTTSLCRIRGSRGHDVLTKQQPGKTTVMPAPAGTHRTTLIAEAAELINQSFEQRRCARLVWPHCH